jgi:pyruvate,water dikinase
LDSLRRLLTGFDHRDVTVLAERAAAARRIVHEATGNLHLTAEIRAAYRALEESCRAMSIPTSSTSTSRPIEGCRAVLSRALGRKEMRLVYARTGTRNRPTSRHERAHFCLEDREVLDLAGCAMHIEDHYSELAGHPTPMDIEWAKDGADGKLYIVQARPETVASRRPPDAFEIYALKGAGAVLVTGRAVGEKIGSGPLRVIADKRDLARFRPGEVLVAETTTPDWEPVMKEAAAIVTSRGGRTCHAAIVARELGVPAVVGAEGAVDKLATGRAVTVSCAEGEAGRVYDGALPFAVTCLATTEVSRPHTQIMVNLGNPERAYHTATLPNDGVDLAGLGIDSISVNPASLLATFNAVAAAK